MTRKDWTVGKYGVRPAGKPDECFYCGAKVGEQHKPNCVIRKKTIVTRMTIDFVDSVPENWDKDVIDFHYNDSSWCASNILNRLEERSNFHCLCDVASFEYLRDATEEDEENWGVVKVNELEG